MRLEVHVTGQLDFVSENDVDFLCHITVTDFTNTKGNYSPMASDPSEYFGDQYLEWEYDKVYVMRDNGDRWFGLSEKGIHCLHEEYGTHIDDMVWNECVLRQQEKHDGYL